MGTLVFIGLVFIVIVVIASMIGNAKKLKYENLLKEIPIYWTENLGRDFIVVGSVSSTANNRFDAEMSILEQSKKLGANAIICSPLGISTHSGGGVSSSRGFDGKMKINDTSYTSNTFHYNGSAIKFKENIQNDNISVSENNAPLSENDEFGRNELNNLIKLSNNLSEQILQFEENISIEIDKQKKLLDNGIINDDEFKNRIDIAKTNLLYKRKELEELESKIKFKTTQVENKEEESRNKEDKLNFLIASSGMLLIKKKNNGDVVLDSKSGKVLWIIKYRENEWIISEKIHTLTSEEINWLKSYNVTSESSNVNIEESKIVIHVSEKEYKEYKRN